MDVVGTNAVDPARGSLIRPDGPHAEVTDHIEGDLIGLGVQYDASTLPTVEPSLPSLMDRPIPAPADPPEMKHQIILRKVVPEQVCLAILPPYLPFKCAWST